MGLEWTLLCTQRCMDPSLVLTTGQSFGWSPVGDDTWVGVIDSFVIELRKAGDNVEYRNIFGDCDVKRLRAYFDLDYSYTIDRSIAPDSVLRIVDRRVGVRILQQDPLETLVSFICSANNNIKRITRMCYEIRSSYGTLLGSKDYNGTTLRFYSFPTLSQLSAADFTSLGLGFRAKYVARSISFLRENGLEWLLNLRDIPYPEALEELVKLPGVGRKVADCILLYSLGKRECVPVDVHVNRIAKLHFGIRASGSGSYDRIHEAFLEM
eukprot:XP_001609078.1 8-oxoguanine DNA glycosylase [Babesia bovis T2Bo]